MKEENKKAGSKVFWLLPIFLVMSVFLYAMPTWWEAARDPDGIHPDTLDEDHSAANLGQAMALAQAAYEEMEVQWALMGGAGSDAVDLITTFPNVPDEDLSAALNIGQLKFIAVPFYDRLIEIGLTNAYPWVANTNEDFAVANIGQVKFLFDFEMAFEDADGDGLSDFFESEYGTDPDDYDTDDDGIDDGMENFNGTNPTNALPTSGVNRNWLYFNANESFSPSWELLPNSWKRFVIYDRINNKVTFRLLAPQNLALGGNELSFIHLVPRQ